MITKWETTSERVSRFMKIPPIKKLEWLHQWHESILKLSSKKMMAVRKELREKRQSW